MGQQITLTASDGTDISGYRADPAGTPKGGIVVIQEIFGVNSHIRSVCDKLASEGYVALAPALFDRLEPNFESGYSPSEIEHARTFIANADFDTMLTDTQAAIDELKGIGPTGIVGFCLGGSIAFSAATDLTGLSAAVGYYGSRIAKVADKKPKVPTLLFFGELDASIPLSDVDIIKEKRKDCEIRVFKGAQHGFNCDQRGSYDKESAETAWQQAMAFFAKHLSTSA